MPLRTRQCAMTRRSSLLAPRGTVSAGPPGTLFCMDMTGGHSATQFIRETQEPPDQREPSQGLVDVLKDPTRPTSREDSMSLRSTRSSWKSLSSNCDEFSRQKSSLVCMGLQSKVPPEALAGTCQSCSPAHAHAEKHTDSDTDTHAEVVRSRANIGTSPALHSMVTNQSCKVCCYDVLSCLMHVLGHALHSFCIESDSLPRQSRISNVLRL